MDRPRLAPRRTVASGLALFCLTAAPALADGHHGKERYVLVPAQRSYAPAEATRVYERRVVVAADADAGDSADRSAAGGSEFQYTADGQLKYLGADAAKAPDAPAAKQPAAVVRDVAVQRVYVREFPVERVVVREAPVERVIIREVPAQRVIVREAAEPVYLLRGKHHFFGR